MEFRVLGPLEVLDRTGSTVDVGSKQQRALLALLVANSNRVVATDRILEELWPNDPDGKEKTLWVYISRLRGALEPFREANSKPTVLVTRDHGYSLKADPNQIDANRFEKLVERGRGLVRDEPEAAAKTLDEALVLWRGEPYEDFAYEEFAQAEIARLNELRIGAIEDRIDAAIRSGHHRDVIGELEGLAREHPLRERPVELLMITLYRSGRQADALRAYQRHRRTVGEELGIEPSPELRRVEEQVLLHDPRLTPYAEESAPDATGKNPFKGLQAFAENDVGEFFGRERMVSEIVRHLSDSRLVALIGASGSGKSSVVGAGLIPTIRKGALGGPESLLIAQMVPGARPFTELEAALLRSTLDAPDSLAELLDDPDEGLLRAGLRLLPDTRGRLVLVIDQFEELFTLVESESERRRFIRNLEVAMDDPHGRIVVVLALRADFYDRPLEYGSFAAHLGANVINVVPLTPDELEAAAEGPAAHAGVQLEPALVSRLLADVAGQSGGLPLFQYALTELFDRRSGATLTTRSYLEMGGVKGAITQRAEELYLELTPAEQAACKQLFLRLVTIAEAGAWSRRRVAASEIVTIAEDVVDLTSVLDRFGQFRLLTFDRDYATGSPTVEVAHEALLHEWQRLNEWIAEGRDDVLRHGRFLTALGEWQAAGQKPDYLLSGERLADYEGWAGESTLRLGSAEQRFLDASIDRRERQMAVEEERNAREAKLGRQAERRLRGLVATGVAVAAIVVGVILIAALATDPPHIVAVHGTPGDLGTNDLVLDGATTAEAEYDIEIQRHEPLIDVEAELRELAVAGADLIIVARNSQFDFAVETVALEHPEVHFVAMAPVAIHAEAPNITEVHFREEESAFLAGSAAALTSQTKKVGFIGGFQDSPIERSRNGFEQGVAFEDSDVQVVSAYLGPLENPLASWNSSPALAKQLAIEMYESGVDVIYHDAGESGLGVIDAAEELSDAASHLWVIGSDVDEWQTTSSPVRRRHILTSTIKRYDTAVVQAVDAYLQGELAPGELFIGLAEDAVELSRFGGHLEAAGIDGTLKNREGELVIGHLGVNAHAETSPVWQLEPDVVVALELHGDKCEVIAVSGASYDEERIRIPRGAVIRFDLVNLIDGVGGVALWTVDHSVNLPRLREEARAGIPESFERIIGMTLVESRSSTAASAVMTGESFVPNCIDHEGVTAEGDSMPSVIVSPDQ